MDIPSHETPNFLNAYFVNIDERPNIVTPDNTFMDFENLYNVNEELCFTKDLPTPEELLLHAENIDRSKSSGVPEISIRQCSDVLSGIPDIVCCIYVTSIQSGIFPSVWSKDIVSLIPKSGDLSDPGNWRPITQTPVFSKMYEKLIYRRLFDHLDTYDLFSKFQYCFLPGRSTQTACFDLTKHIYSALNNKKIFGSASLDVSKAFDSVNHRLLLYKLRAIGLSRFSLDWFTSYLKRSQCVLFENTLLCVVPNKSGIGQGTILGPILFILYINDIVNYIGDTNINMYADDCIIYCTGNNWDRVHNTLQQSLGYVTRWLGQNALKLNVKKSKCLVISAKSKLGMIDLDVPLTLDDQPLDFIENYNFLGVILDAKMSLKPLLSHVKKITTGKIKTLYKISKYIDTPYLLLRNLRPKINYEKISFSGFHLNISLIPIYIITFYCCHQIALDLSFNLKYCDLEYDN